MLSRISGRSVLASFCAFLFQRNWGPQAAQRLGRQLADSGPVGRRSGVCIASLQILAPQAAGPRYVLPAPVLGITQILAHKAKFTIYIYIYVYIQVTRRQGVCATFGRM